MAKGTLFDRVRSWFGGSVPPAPPGPEERAREAELRAFFIARCAAFRQLLAANKAALEDMTRLEGMLTAPPDPQAVRQVCTALADQVEGIVTRLNALSNNAYPDLPGRLTAIAADLRAALDALGAPAPPDALGAPVPPDAPGAPDVPDAPAPATPSCPATAPSGAAVPLSVRFGTREALNADWCGAKMARLARHALHPPLPRIAVPQGFVATTQACKLFMSATGLDLCIAGLLKEAEDGAQDLALLHRIAAAIRDAILRTALPPLLEQDILREVGELVRRNPGCLLAVRSSALEEDGFEHSFAGQYASILHVPASEAVRAWKNVLASLYGVNALVYRARHRPGEKAAAMCVGFLVMLEAQASGVAYSADPLEPQNQDCIVSAASGLPSAVVDGSVTPDVFRIDPGPPCVLRSRRPGREGGPPVLSDERALDVAQLALALHAEYGCAQDVEWIFDRQGVLNLLQSRPLARSAATELGAEDEAALAALPKLLAGGAIASQGVGSGPACLVRTDREMENFPQGRVLVVARALPKWAPLLGKAAALISEAGGVASHLASVAREYGVPALFGLHGIIERLHSLEDPQARITVDARKGIVYLGGPPAAFSMPKRRAAVEDSPLRRRVQAAAELVCPLHLLDPEAEEFSPAGCRTLHDITRFCHEKAVESLFSTQREGRGKDEPPGKQLKAGVKLKYWLVDMGGGFSTAIHTPYVDIRDIRSLPMLALWNGMTSIPWAGPPAPDGRGFLSVVARSASNPELDPLAANSMTEKNYFLISRSFCTLQTRIGYHFCTVEAEAGAEDHANYASFHFKGGAASRDRRALRVRLMADLLQEHGFAASAQGDALFAHAEDASQQDILDKTRILGYLLIHTRQMDMVMRNTAMVAQLNTKLRDEMRALLAMPFETPD